MQPRTFRPTPLRGREELRASAAWRLPGRRFRSRAHGGRDQLRDGSVRRTCVRAMWILRRIPMARGRCTRTAIHVSILGEPARDRGPHWCARMGRACERGHRAPGLHGSECGVSRASHLGRDHPCHPGAAHAHGHSRERLQRKRQQEHPGQEHADEDHGGLILGIAQAGWGLSTAAQRRIAIEALQICHLERSYGALASMRSSPIIPACFGTSGR